MLKAIKIEGDDAKYIQRLFAIVKQLEEWAPMSHYIFVLDGSMLLYM